MLYQQLLELYMSVLVCILVQLTNSVDGNHVKALQDLVWPFKRGRVGRWAGAAIDCGV